MKTLTEADVEFELTAEPEDMDPADSFEFPEDIAIARRGGWNWFQACVTARWTDANGVNFQGSDHLGGCSYASEEDFKKDGYYTAMKAEALADLNKNIAEFYLRRAAPRLLEALEGLAHVHSPEYLEDFKRGIHLYPDIDASVALQRARAALAQAVGEAQP